MTITIQALGLDLRPNCYHARSSSNSGNQRRFDSPLSSQMTAARFASAATTRESTWGEGKFLMWVRRSESRDQRAKVVADIAINSEYILDGSMYNWAITKVFFAHPGRRIFKGRSQDHSQPTRKLSKTLTRTLDPMSSYTTLSVLHGLGTPWNRDIYF